MKNLLLVFALLMTMVCCTTERQRTAMRQGLDSLNQRNRTNQPFTVQEADSFVRFFDNHGTANDRLLAHYLLGRAYYEHGEAPMALECYHDAINCADTTAQDCDYAQLARVYAQLADLFYNQTLFRQQLTYEKLAEHYAWKGKDTLSAIQCYDSQSLAFSELGLTDSAIIIAEEASRLYENNGYSDFAATTLGGISRLLIDKGDIAKARKYMNAYESKSGNFDESGNIEDGREMYYHFKGLLYLACANLDSAEYWFRKELKDGKDVYNQNGGAVGLGKVYDQRNMSDSAAKYYRYAYAMNDSAFMQMSTQSVGQMQAMYNYSRIQDVAHQESRRANRATTGMIVGISTTIIILLFTYLIYYSINRKRKEAILKYRNSLAILEHAQSDIINLRNSDLDKDRLIQEKEKLISKLQNDINKHNNNSITNQIKVENQLKESEEYRLFLNYSRKGLMPEEENWKKLHIKVYELLPEFRQLMIANNHLLTTKEYLACFLVRLHFKPSDLCNMLGISSGHASKIRKSLLQKLFGIEGKADEFDAKIKEIF